MSDTNTNHQGKYLDYNGLTFLWKQVLAGLDKKVSTELLANVATSGSYADLIDTPTSIEADEITKLFNKD